MADDLSLLFRLRADNTQAKAAMADTRAAVSQLRQSFGPQLSQSVALSNKAFSELGDNLNNFVAQRLPIVGGAFVRVTNSLKGFHEELKRGGGATEGLAKSIDSIAKASGKSTTEITRFLTSFSRLEGSTARNDAAFKAFGGSVDLIGNKTAKFLPELESASESMLTASTNASGLAASVAGLAGPIGIAVAAIVAQTAAVAALGRQIFILARASADYQGKLFDLSQQVGVSVETLSALEVVARTTGGSIESLVQSLGIFQRHLEEAQDPGSKAASTFKRLGIETTNTEQALRQAIAALARMPEGFRQTATALELFGRGGKAFLAIAKESKGDIDEITRKLGNLGLVTTEQAKLADEFNDQLILLEVQLRGLGTKTIPVVLDVMKDLSKTVEDNRDVFGALQIGLAFTAQQIAGPLKFALITARTEFEKIRTVIEAIAGQRISFTRPEGGTPTPPPEETKDPFTKELEENIAARRKAQNVLNFEFAEQQRQAAASIAQAQRDFEAGKKSREDLLNATIAGIKKQTQAELESLKIERDIKLRELALAKDEVDKKTQLTNALFTLDTQIAAKRAELRQRELDERAKFQREEVASEIAHQERLLARSQELDQVKITGILQQVALRKKAALDGDKEIENIELTAIDRQQALLVRKLEIAGADLAKQKEIKDVIDSLNTQRTATEQRHSQQRLSIAQEEADVSLTILRIKGDALIATTQALAEARVITEEEAERRISKIRLDALDEQINLARARGADTRVLEAEREAFAQETERNIEAGRQRDLENERRYAAQLKTIKERIRDIERDAAEEAIRLMVIQFTSRKDIIRAERDLELQREEERHRRETTRINEQKRQVDEEIRVLQKRLERLKVGTTEEIEEHERLIESLERLRVKRAELEREQGAEDERSETRKRRVTVEAELEIANPDAALQDVFDGLGESLTNLASKFAEVIGAGEEFAAMSAQIAQQIGGALAGAFDQFANALGQTVANWVLLGETGPAVMRKILAQSLATLAAEAAVQAIKQLALGFATLFFNPAESAAHFTAAALWGSIAGASAIAGRSVAGDLFKPKNAASGGGERAGAGQVDPLTLNRNQAEPTRIIVQLPPINVNPNDRFGQAVTATWADDYENGGVTREIIANDGKL